MYAAECNDGAWDSMQLSLMFGEATVRLKVYFHSLTLVVRKGARGASGMG